jgi:hypothetical protein
VPLLQPCLLSVLRSDEDDRFLFRTWPFGERHHQARVDVRYRKTRSPFVQDMECRVRVCFSGPARTRIDAMKKMLVWARRYQKKGPTKPKDAFIHAFRWYADVHQTRLGFLDFIFQTSGSGYSWLDGCLFDPDPESLAIARSMNARQHEMARRQADFNAVTARWYAFLGQEHEPAEVKAVRASPAADDASQLLGALRPDTALFSVPDDAHPTWQALSYRYAQQVLSRVQDDQSRALLASLIADLKKRFPRLGEETGPCYWNLGPHVSAPPSWGKVCVYCGQDLAHPVAC